MAGSTSSRFWNSICDGGTAVDVHACRIRTSEPKASRTIIAVPRTIASQPRFRYGPFPTSRTVVLIRPPPGAARARRLFLTAETFDAAAAATFGLVDHVADADALDATVERITGEIRRGGPQALAEVKRLLADLAAAGPAETGGLTARRIAALRAGDEGQEGMSAFLEKRPPRWIR